MRRSRLRCVCFDTRQETELSLQCFDFIGLQQYNFAVFSVVSRNSLDLSGPKPPDALLYQRAGSMSDILERKPAEDLKLSPEGMQQWLILEVHSFSADGQSV